MKMELSVDQLTLCNPARCLLGFAATASTCPSAPRSLTDRDSQVLDFREARCTEISSPLMSHYMIPECLHSASDPVCPQVLFADIPVGLASVDCDGTETSLLECQNNGRLAPRCTNKTSSTVLACGTTATGAPSVLTHEESGIIASIFFKAHSCSLACVHCT